ncbi:hypothetical protein CANINC_002615 [Pichia inconspicua]|uniref:SAP domain-containing protein n=1 Tax=Pichia inconspicua TaxID=52247 RepID=A0A4T0X0N3_9ASCO|nr:hypothetical protein CANINC_002615 [[Candida] inconspicua]
MLRAVKSLPSLRLLYQQEVACLKTNAPTTIKVQQQVRNVHQTTKKETILLDQSANKSKYTTMNLQGLKMECRKRGLKVSGRKIDLVQRLSSQDEIAAGNSRSYSKVTNNINGSKDMPLELKDFKMNEVRSSSELKMKKKPTEKNSDVISKMKAQQEQQMSELKNKIEEQKVFELKQKRDLEKRRQSDLLIQNERRKQLELKTQEEQRKLQEKKRELELREQIELQKQIELQNQVEQQKLQERKAVLKNVVHSAVLSSVRERAAADALKKAEKESKLKIIQEAKESMQSSIKKQKEQQQKQQREQSSQEDNDLTRRDVAFLTVFSASTIGWWSLKD